MLHVCLPVHVVHVHVHVILSCTCPGVHVHVYVPAWRRSRALHSTAANATLPTVPHITVRAPQRPKGAAQDVPTSRCCHDYLLLTSHARHSLRLTGRTRYTGTRAHSCGALHLMLTSTLSRGQAPRHALQHALSRSSAASCSPTRSPTVRRRGLTRHRRRWRCAHARARVRHNLRPTGRTRYTGTRGLTPSVLSTSCSPSRPLAVRRHVIHTRHRAHVLPWALP